jgi:hypothetical protein
VRVACVVCRARVNVGLLACVVIGWSPRRAHRLLRQQERAAQCHLLALGRRSVRYAASRSRDLVAGDNHRARLNETCIAVHRVHPHADDREAGGEGRLRRAPHQEVGGQDQVHPLPGTYNRHEKKKKNQFFLILPFSMTLSVDHPLSSPSFSHTNHSHQRSIFLMRSISSTRRRAEWNPPFKQLAYTKRCMTPSPPKLWKSTRALGGWT